MSKELVFDTIIIGSGLGGLICANILAMEGKSVCVLEKNEQIGGNLQTFRRDGVTFDTGVHYISGLDKGQNLHQIFHYLNILDRIDLKRMDEKAFDNILFDGDENVYTYAMSYPNFESNLLVQFPQESAAISSYIQDIKKVCDNFPMYNLVDEDRYRDDTIFTIGVYDYFQKLTRDEKLRAVLAGTNILYAGSASHTPFYMHALMINSYIESSWKCIKGGDQIAKALAKNIRALNGQIFRKQEVVELIEKDGEVKSVIAKDGTVYTAKNFISNISPLKTLQMTNSNLFRKVYKERVASIKNTTSAFSLYLVLKPETYLSKNKNFYFFQSTDVLNAIEHSTKNWPFTYALFEVISEKNPLYCDGLIIMTYMDFNEVKSWDSTYNTTLEESERGEEYIRFKSGKAEKLLEVVQKKFPNLRSQIKSYYTSTPLSYRDYIGTTDGNMYGVAKDYRDPLKTKISPLTKIPNLYFTGANINLHGILGVSISALVTSSLLIGKQHLLNKIKAANEVIS